MCDLLITFNKLKNETETYTKNPIIDSIDMNILRTIVISEDEYIAEMKNKLSTMLDKLNVFPFEDWKDFYNEYCELKAYITLKSLDLNIDRYDYDDVHKNKTPDFKFEYSGKEFFLEVKAPVYFRPSETFESESEKGFDVRYDMQKQHDSGEKVLVGMFQHDPFGFKNTLEYESSTFKIERIIDKINQNIKKKQYEKGDTFLFVDFSLFSFFDSAPYCHNLLKSYESRNKNLSGKLWHIAFTELGEKIKKYVRFNGESNIDKEMQKVGILVDNLFIKGIVFNLRGIDKRNILLGVCRDYDTESKEILSNICCSVNTELNSFDSEINKLRKENCKTSCNIFMNKENIN